MSTPEQRFIDAWRIASPVLEQVRRDELRQLDEQAGAKMISKTTTSETPYSGLAVFQSWMMRLRVLELMKKPPQ